MITGEGEMVMQWIEGHRTTSQRFDDCLLSRNLFWWVGGVVRLKWKGAGHLVGDRVHNVRPAAGVLQGLV